MAAQIREQGRNLGGRPPYGYRLVDGGPHPNEKHAAWGRRRHRLDVDPVSAPHVRWIFARRLDGVSTAGIARLLNQRGVASPGSYDRQRNRHRVGPVRVWNPRADWVVSAEHTHPALVSDQDFLTAQQITAVTLPEDGRTRRYALTGLLICQVCGRRLDGHWVNQKPAYRCRHGHTSAHPPNSSSTSR
jgi:hypothetical protein